MLLDFNIFFLWFRKNFLVTSIAVASDAERSQKSSDTVSIKTQTDSLQHFQDWYCRFFVCFVAFVLRARENREGNVAAESCLRAPTPVTRRSLGEGIARAQHVD